MAIVFHPKPGMVLICDYSTGFVPPEMVKRRRVIVLSPYQQNKRGLCTVIPLSTTPPDLPKTYHHCIPVGKYDFLSRELSCWVKADILATVSLVRLDRIRYNGHFISPSINEEDFQAIRQCVKHYLDFL